MSCPRTSSFLGVPLSLPTVALCFLKPGRSNLTTPSRCVSVPSSFVFTNSSYPLNCSFPLLRTKPAAKAPSLLNDPNSRHLKSISRHWWNPWERLVVQDAWCVLTSYRSLFLLTNASLFVYYRLLSNASIVLGTTVIVPTSAQLTVASIAQTPALRDAHTFTLEEHKAYASRIRPLAQLANEGLDFHLC